ncbi:MAG: hypothetical protein IK010_00110 [Bacteroidales bacterium]|nr:hypothetical protein [Bacteroidales bacterium]MBR5092451.1 hypothetical protein [Bacteroidales bacterium]
MKKKILPLMIVVLSLAGCAKDKQCKCVTTDVPDDGLLKVLVVDGGMKCSDIVEMAIEVKDRDENGNYTLRRTEVHKVKCRDYAE